MCVGMAGLGGGGTSYFLPHGGHALSWILDDEGDERVVHNAGVQPLMVQIFGLCVALVVTAAIQRVGPMKRSHVDSILNAQTRTHAHSGACKVISEEHT